MMRILQCIGSLEFGGAQSFIMEIYRKIDRSEFQFDFIVFEGEIRDNYHEIVELGGIVYECPRYCPRNHKKFVQWWKNFFQEHTEYQILHAHLRSCISLVLPIARKAGCITIVHSHSTSNGTGMKSTAKAILQWPIRFQADYLFACSEESGRWLFGKAALKKDNYRTIPNCIDIERYAFSQKNRERIRNQLHIESDNFVLGHVGRFHPAKNHRFLIGIFENVLKKCPQAKLLLVGDGELAADIQTYCMKSGIWDNVIFAGSQADTAPYYSAMDVFVFPSLWEGVPVSVVEAQVSGLPCFISNTITKDVQLTESVIPISLEDRDGAWAEYIISCKAIGPRALDNNKRQAYELFDSSYVAADLCRFYKSNHNAN